MNCYLLHNAVEEDVFQRGAEVHAHVFQVVDYLGIH